MSHYKLNILFGFFMLSLFSCGESNQQTAQIHQENKEETTPQSSEQETTKETKEKTVTKGAKAQFTSSARSIGPAKSSEQIAIEAAVAKMKTADKNSVLGYWFGDFGSNKITIVLSEVGEGQAVGHSVCAGNYRIIKGSQKELGKGVYSFKMDEPGDDKYDGSFEFEIDINKESLKGKWAPFKKTVKAKTYELKKQDFEYVAENGKYPQASERLLTEADVENYGPEELKIMRNEIYARHGYSFKKKDIRQHFENQIWYMPVSTDVRETLTDIEVKNIDLIYEYETYYEDYYDEFGR